MTDQNPTDRSGVSKEKHQLEKGDTCPKCGREIIHRDTSRLPPVAFKKLMFDVCFFDGDEQVTYGYRGNCVLAFHEEVRK